MKCIACLYGRILTNRLELWLPFNSDQISFQKGKFTLIHMFTLRLISEIAKKIHVVRIEALLNHTLIHADDTIILSTSRNEFIYKCNELVTFLNESHLNLNLGKSGYLIINPKICDIKGNIILNLGVLMYNASFEYLGVFVADTGSLKQDVKNYIDHMRSVSIKYTNFCKTNKNAPFYTKLEVFDKCVTSALIYGCEVWGEMYK